MTLQTPVNIPAPGFSISPHDRLLFVGSCFADNIGRRFIDNQFRATVNPYGVMYNPASILHTVERYVNAECRMQNAESQSRELNSAFCIHNSAFPDVAIFTLGTNHVYIDKGTRAIVDNCQKRPHSDFDERELTVDECADYLEKAVQLLAERNPDVKIILTVSPIRYAKYGFHGSQLSKVTLLLATEKVEASSSRNLDPRSVPGGLAAGITYFPAYEIMNDELRDYRFYAPDMLHPSEQAVDYIYERFAETYFSPEVHVFVREWQPIKAALAHRPFNPDSAEYRIFRAKAEADAQAFHKKWNLL